MKVSDPDWSPNKRRKLEGHDSFSDSIPSNRDGESLRKTVIHTTHLSDDQDPKLLHSLNGGLIIRHSHIPFASGGFCDIFTGHSPAYGKVAMRRPRMTEKGHKLSDMRDFLAESEIWKKLNHPNILQFLGLIHSDGYIWAVSRFAENGPLPAYLKDRPATDRRVLVLQLADAIGYLHFQGVIHGDIKGSNILISAVGAIFLCDFGLSKSSGSLTRTSLSGAASVRWCAPELLFDDEATKTYASDVYSFGMTIYEILSGNAPLYDTPNEVLVMNAINAGVRPPRDPATSESGESYEQLWSIASESWNEKASNRPSMEIICKRLGVTITLPLGTTAEESADGVIDIMVDAMDGEQIPRGISNLDERSTDFFQAVQTGIDEVIQKIPRAKAQYDSSLRRGAQRCLQGTRTELVETIHGWIDGTGPTIEPIFWLSGEAGTGKSTIAHTIAEDRDEAHQLGASFFFSRNEEARRDATLFISTLAYQLSVFDKGFKAHLAAALYDDPTLPEKTIKIQLKRMVMEPLTKSRTLATRTIVIVVDAVDECSPDAGAEEILEAWAELIRDFPLRFRLFITSRPSWHIKTKIQSARHLSTIFHLRDISTTIVKSDIERYFRVSLADVLDDELAHVALELLSQRVGLLFILASTHVRYIKDPFRADPRGQLRALLQRTPTLGLMPEAELDVLYLDIVQGVPQGLKTQTVINAFKEVVGGMVVAGVPMTPIQLSNLLKMGLGDVLYILRRLSSVIFLPEDGTPTSFFHQSFPEFLTDAERCTNSLYAIDKPQAHLHMALKCLDVFDEHLQCDPETIDSHQKQQPATADDPQTPEQAKVADPALEIPAQDSEIPEAISLLTSKAYPDFLCYACVYSSYHLQAVVQGESHGHAECLARFESFYTHKRTQWLDVVTSLHDIPGLHDLPARLHCGYIKYYLKHGTPSEHMLKQMVSVQLSLQPYGFASPSPASRRRVNAEQLAYLERIFVVDRFPATAKRQEIGDLLGIPGRQIQIWFQNRRAKDKYPASRNQVIRGPRVTHAPAWSPPEPDMARDPELQEQTHTGEPITAIP